MKNPKTEVKQYFHLLQSGDGNFRNSEPIAWITIDTTKEQREKLADFYTKGQFSKQPGFYKIIGPIFTPSILSF